MTNSEQSTRPIAPLAIVSLTLAVASLVVAYLLPDPYAPLSWIVAVPAVVTGFLVRTGDLAVARAGIVIGLASIALVAIYITT